MFISKTIKVMKTTKRFDTAVTKLYNAFNKGTLNANDCEYCAVGNLCDSQKTGIHWFTGNALGSLIDYSTFLSCGNFLPKHKDYNSEELFEIERLFLLAHQDYAIKSGMAKSVKNINDYFPLQCEISRKKEAQFNGLMLVIEYLAELDNIEVPQITIEQFKEVLVGV